jgi:hypothetical protein
MDNRVDEWAAAAARSGTPNLQLERDESSDMI